MAKAQRRGKVPRKRGGQLFVPTDADRKVVLLTIGRGVPHADIRAKIINPRTGAGIDTKTFVKAFAAEIEEGEAEIDNRVHQYLASWATGRRGHTMPAVTAAIYWTKAKMKWRDRDPYKKPGEGDADDEIKVTGGLPERET